MGHVTCVLETKEHGNLFYKGFLTERCKDLNWGLPEKSPECLVVNETSLSSLVYKLLSINGILGTIGFG